MWLVKWIGHFVASKASTFDLSEILSEAVLVVGLAEPYAAEAGWQEVDRVVGNRGEGLVDRVIQLVMADTHFMNSE